MLSTHRRSHRIAPCIARYGPLSTQKQKKKQGKSENKKGKQIEKKKLEGQGCVLADLLPSPKTSESQKHEKNYEKNTKSPRPKNTKKKSKKCEIGQTRANFVIFSYFWGPSWGGQLCIFWQFFVFLGFRQRRKKRTRPPERKSFGELFCPQRKTFQVGGGYKNPMKTKKPYLPPKSFLCGPHFFSAKKSSALEHGGVCHKGFHSRPTKIVKRRWATDPGPRKDLFDDSKKNNFSGSRKSNSKMTPKMTFPWERVKI